jgi:CubicO group peptidase (beta-lactamase class C family)
MSRGARRAASVVVSLLAVVAGGLGNTASAVTAPGDVPVGGGVATVPSDPSQFKNCAEPDMSTPYATARPEEVGLDAATLEATADWYTSKLQATMRVYRFGCLVQTTRLDPAVDRMLDDMASIAKPAMTLVLGRAVALGHLDVDDPLGRFFPDKGDDAHRAITVRQLLNHTSGVRMVLTNEINTMRADSVASFFALPIEHRPGTWFQYAQIPATVTTAVVQQATGVNFRTFAQEQLFDKIGIAPGTWIWKTDRAGWTEGWNEFYLRPRDLVRLGQLMLQGGVWKGEQLIPAGFMRQMATGTPQNPGFGFNSWLNSAPWYVTIGLNERRTVEHALIQSAPHDMYYGWGWRGRHIYVMPDLQMVVTTTPLGVQVPLPGQFFDGYPGHDLTYDEIDAHQTAQGEQRGGFHEFFRMLMRAVTDQHVPDPGPWTDPPDNSFNPDPWTDPVTTVNGMEPGDTTMSGFCSWCAGSPGVYAKALTTD